MGCKRRFEGAVGIQVGKTCGRNTKRKKTPADDTDKSSHSQGQESPPQCEADEIKDESTVREKRNGANSASSLRYHRDMLWRRLWWYSAQAAGECPGSSLKLFANHILT